jgi:hypothetical protein
MSSIYYPESWMQHPEVLRLQQNNREWARMYHDQLAEIEKLKKKLHLATCDLGQYIQRATVAEARYKGAQEEIQKLELQMEAFNRLSFIRKATFHFRID